MMDEIEARYQRLERVSALAQWNRALGKEDADAEVQAAGSALEAFFHDASVDEAIERFAVVAGEADRARVEAWRQLRRRRARLEDPRLRSADEHVRATLHRDDGMAPLWVLYGSPDPAARREALDALTARTSELVQALVMRAAVMDEVAREQGHVDHRDWLGVDEQRLATVCEAQIAASLDDWRRLQDHALEQLGRPPGLADHLAVATAWTGRAGGFFTVEGVPALADDAFRRMGFAVPDPAIQVVRSSGRPGGAAYPISVPDDVRFHGSFPPGYEGARGWFHEYGHALHLRSVDTPLIPHRGLPGDPSITEGIADVLTLPLRDRAWLREVLPAVEPERIDELVTSVEAFDALAVRYNCMFARLELAIYQGRDFAAAFGQLHRETMGTPPADAPVFVMLPYLETAGQLRHYVYARGVQAELVRRLEGHSLLTPRAGRFLRGTLMAPGAGLDVERWWAEPVGLEAWEAAHP